MSENKTKHYEYYPDGVPCKGSACWAHKTKPCEYCGRVSCKGDVEINKDTMSKNTLHPELVEKMYQAYRGNFEQYDFSPSSIPKQCAQIAVDFSNENVVSAVAELSQDITVLKQQRDELLEALRESQLQLEYLSKKFGETGSGNYVISRNNVIIKKHEDGKE